MIIPRREDAIHKNWMYRVLSEIADDTTLNGLLRFKGGTCAAMRGIIDRFSVDLDFDLMDDKKIKQANSHLEKIFKKLGLQIKDHSLHVPQYFVKYDNKPGERNTLRIDVTTPPPASNDYEPVRLTEIDRIINCQTAETMFANKLVATLERYEKHKSIAGRDIFDIHTFYTKGLTFKEQIIVERRQTGLREFFTQLEKFIEKNITQKILNEDLNSLMEPEAFRKTRKYLKGEVMTYLKAEIKRVGPVPTSP
ncbi:nucleotidyl transferase AbiEii/AbiGii toxin family protein [Patescibacteria group bacterium]|nr:nucleotidyl transferase AbiEii/AbiGii toxin family protein [Patescibacteria group bacterium]